MNLKPAAAFMVLIRTLMPALGATPADPADLDQILSFESSRAGAFPPGWGGGPRGTQFADQKVVHGGSWAGRLERTAKSPGTFSTFTASIPVNFAGTRIELRGFVRTEGVKGWAGLWVREGVETGYATADYFHNRPVRGTTGWTQYTLDTPMDRAGTRLYFGVVLSGEGKVWLDDVELLVDGNPVQFVPKVERAKTVLDTDHEFDAGSKVTIDALTPVQTANLVTLGKLWGFLKYHHAKIVSGAVHWDYELFRVMPRVLAAADRSGAQKVILDWVKGLGDVAPCDQCASLPFNPALGPDLDWIHDRATLGEPLSVLLEHVYRNRPPRGDQAYVAKVARGGHPQFRLEKDYSDFALPDAGMRILALYRWWNIVQYWSPYRDVVGADWSAVLPEFLPRMVAADSVDRYRLEMLALIARLNDTHAYLPGALSVRPPRGDCQVPVRLRFVEGKAVVVDNANDEAGPATVLKPGDAILALDGAPVDRLIDTWKPYYSASNDACRMDLIVGALTQGACGPVKLRVERSGAPLELSTERRPKSEPALRSEGFYDLQGPAFRRLSPDVAYLKLSTANEADLQDYLRGAAGTKGWIIDIRNYPSDSTPWTLGGHFVSEPTPFALFTTLDTANPGAFAWQSPVTLEPTAPFYPGKVVILVDEVSVSSAEFAAMQFRAAPNAIVVGSTTRAADGNVSYVPLPGGLKSRISGIGVFYPDKRPTQRIGIVPDVDARPSIAGIREGRDEELEAAVRQILGPNAPESKIRETAKP